MTVKFQEPGLEYLQVVAAKIEDGTAHKIEVASFSDYAGPLETKPQKYQVDFYALWGGIYRRSTDVTSGVSEYGHVYGQALELFECRYPEIKRHRHLCAGMVEQWRRENDQPEGRIFTYPCP